MKRVYISSTYRDLVMHRVAVTQVLRRMGLLVIGMEDYAASDERPLDRCLNDIKQVDLYVGIVAWHYGSVPKNNNPERLSITELEYRLAREVKIPRLVFLADRTGAWPADSIDAITGSREDADAVLALRHALQTERLAAFFTSAESLANEVAAAVGFQLRADSWLTDAVMTAALQGQTDRYSAKTVDAEAVQNWRLGKTLSSAHRERLAVILQGFNEHDYATIDLGDGDMWSSSRLFLLAAMVSDYTELNRFVFIAGDRYVGTATARETHVKLARQFPRYDLAYRLSRPAPGVVPQLVELVDLAEPYNARLAAEHHDELWQPRADDEGGVIDWVTSSRLRAWLGASLHSDAVEGPVERPSVLAVYDVMQKVSSHVALLDNGRFRELANRHAIANSVANAVLRHRIGETSN